MVKTITIEKKQTSMTKRLIAYLIDVIIINLIIIMPFNKNLESLSMYNDDFFAAVNFFMNNPDKILQVTLISITIMILSVAYWTILEFKLRQSIGKMIMNIKVVSKKKNFTIWQCIVRNISKPVSLVFLFDVLYLLFNRKENQRFFEKISDTTVIEEVMKI